MPEVYSHRKTKVNLAKSTHISPTEAELKHHPRHTRNPLASYCYYPHGVNFMDKDEEERVIVLVRKHPITNIPWILAAILMILAPAALSAVPFLDFLQPQFQTMAILLWYLITTAFVLEQFLTWFFNVNIITDERIFDVDFYNLLYREMTHAQIEQVQDVTVRMGSVIRTIFNYGDVLIQTAAEVPQIEFDAVPHPDELSKILRNLQLEEQQEKLEGRIR